MKSGGNMPGYVKKKRFDARPDRNAAEQGGDRTGGCVVGNNDGIVCGRNAVRELIRSGRAVDKIFVLAGPREGSVNQITALARERKIPVIEAKAEKLDALCGGVNHQGICAMAAQKEYSSVEDILAFAAPGKAEAPLSGDSRRNRGSPQSRRAHPMRRMCRSARNHNPPEAQRRHNSYGRQGFRRCNRAYTYC